MFNFLTKHEEQIINEFKKKGFFKVKHSDNLLKMIKESLHNSFPKSFSTIHQEDIHNFNEFRLRSIQELNKNKELHRNIYLTHKEYLDTLLGNELCIQKNINLSIHRPEEDSDLLDIHSDSLCGNSNFELVVWIPLTKAYQSNSMYILPLNKSLQAAKELKEGKYPNIDELKNNYKNDFEFVELEEGESLIFTHNLLHGNVINTTPDTRVSINIRFKSSLTPFGAKKIGEYYMPITTRPMTIIGNQFYEI